MVSSKKAALVLAASASAASSAPAPASAAAAAFRPLLSQGAFGRFGVGSPQWSSPRCLFAPAPLARPCGSGRKEGEGGQTRGRQPPRRSFSSAAPPPSPSSSSSPLSLASRRTWWSPLPASRVGTDGFEPAAASAEASLASTSSRCTGALRVDVLADGGEGGGAEADAALAAAAAAAVLGGGDYAGYSAAFSWPGGRLLPVPGRWVPRDLVEWGQVPSCLEVLTSEGGLSDASRAWSRQTLTVLPATGCDVDNLDTARSSATRLVVAAAATEATGRRPVRILVYRPDGASRRRVDVEVAFDLGADPRADQQDGKEGGAQGTPWSGHRARVTVPLELRREPGGGAGAAPAGRWAVRAGSADGVRLAVERRASDRSTRGTLADGGGLDAATVSRMIGPHLAGLQSDNRLFSAGDQDGESGARGDATRASVALPMNLTLSVSEQRDPDEGAAPRESATPTPGRALLLEVSRAVPAPPSDQEPQGAAGAGAPDSDGRGRTILAARVFIRAPSGGERERSLNSEDPSRHLLDPDNYRFEVRSGVVGSSKTAG